MGVPVGSPLPVTTQLGFSNHSTGLSAHLINRGMSTSRVGWLETEVDCECAQPFVGQSASSDDRGPSDCALLAAGRTLADIPAATERARVACCASAQFCFANR